MKPFLTDKEWQEKIKAKAAELSKNSSLVGASKDAIEEYKKDLNKCYKKLDDKDKLCQDEYRWATYSYATPNQKYDETQQESFRFFIYGYLEYYDEETRSGCIDHAVYIDFGDKEISVYICPKPLKTRASEECTLPGTGLSSDPVPPTAPPPPYP